MFSHLGSILVAFAFQFLSNFTNSQKVTVFLHPDHKGDSEELDISGCVATLKPQFDKTISSVNTQGHCVHLYKEQGCKGPYVLMKPGTPSHHHLPAFEAFGLDDAIRSLGPCHQSPCHPDYIEHSNDTITVEFYEHGDHKGVQWISKLAPKTCLLIAQKLLHQLTSLKLSSPICVEVYEHWNCTGDSRKIPVKSPFPGEVGAWSFDNRAKSISFCGLDCLVAGDRSVVIESPGHVPVVDYVTIYSEPNFNGNYEYIPLSKGCLNISGDWEGEVVSIKGNGHCIHIYEHKGCSRKGNSIQIEVEEQHLKTRNFEGKLRALESCDNSKYPGGGEEKIFKQDGKLDSNWILLIVGVVLVLVVIVAVVGAIFIFRLRRKQRYIVDILTEKEIHEFMNGTENYEGTGSDVVGYAYSLPYNTKYEIPRDLIAFDTKNVLGAGQYAIVFKGSIQHPTSGEKIFVAVKTVKQNAGEEYLRALLKEIKTMSFVGDHPHIVKLVGCYTQNLREELLVMTELCENGSLEGFLKQCKNAFANCVVKGRISSNIYETTFKQQKSYTNLDMPSKFHFNTFHLMDWACQIAEGMEFLASKKVVHGDLATRNILLDSKFQVNIGDFGLSKQLYEYTQYVKKHQAPLPWRWLAIETLTSMQFSTESDVWAYGVTLWELFSLGETPYPGSVWGPDFLAGLRDGLRPPKPNCATSDDYNLMLDCWREEPSKRITFYELKEKLSDLIQMSSNLRSQFIREPAPKKTPKTQELIELKDLP